MQVRVDPSICEGELFIPSSKSDSHRALLCAALSGATSRIYKLANSRDIQATLTALKAFGASYFFEDQTLFIKGGSPLKLAEHELQCDESGSTLRFLIPLLAISGDSVTLKGSLSLMKRPQSVYAKLFQEQGLEFTQAHDHICLKGPLQAGQYVLNGDISSQFISGLLFALALVKGNSTLTITPPFESRAYVDLTIAMLRSFQVFIEENQENTFFIRGGQEYVACDKMIEGDYSQFAFFAVLAAIQGDLMLYNVALDSLQGDREIIAILQNFMVQPKALKQGYHIQKAPLIAHDIDCANCPDLGPILCVLAMYAKGKTRLYHVKRLRYKESDRIQAMEEELSKMGVKIDSSEDEIVIEGAAAYEGGVHFAAHNDHRIVMALCVASLCAKKPCVIHDAQVVDKSYPTFFADVIKIGGKISYD